ncbi:MAG: non-homologous end-joining DNA ligase [Roseovarius sp.]
MNERAAISNLLSQAPQTPMPDWAEPMLAVLTDQRFSDSDWIFERKLDGERLLVFRTGAHTRLMTRNGQDVTDTYPELAEAVAAQPGSDFIADGEAVAFNGQLTSFSRLQGRMQIKDAARALERAKAIPVYLYLFDLLHFDGHDLTGQPLRQRKAALYRCLRFDDPLRYTPHRNEEGEASYREACEKGWEGVIAKDATARYMHGRSRKWLKFKCGHGQEFVICGFTEPSGERDGFGALLLGYFENGALRYAGKVGTGFDDEFLNSFRETLEARRRDTSPFDDAVEEEAHFVRPEIVAEIGFTEWTDDHRLRHPRFLGLRRDKAASEVVREEPAS